MKNVTIRRYRDRLDYLFNQVSSLPDLELQAHWSRYLCVLVSGFLETSIRAIYADYASKKSAPFVANFVQDKLEYFQNPSMAKILDLVQSFNPQWADDLRIRTDGEIRDAINSIVNVRNGIAHGENVGISYAIIRDYYQNAITLIDLIDQQCGT